jgi:flotillin
MVWLIWLIIVVVLAAIAIAFLQRFYRKATRERALIRTGAGGKKVVLDGGFLALPFLHKVEEINMRTMRLEVRRVSEKSLMTEDRLRLDTEMEFYLRVDPTIDGVATAAQALGARALNPEEIKNLFEGRFIDAIQSVVAAKTMDELHENRGAFVKAVADILGPSMAQNGLKLESVSLVRLDQAPLSSLDENNAFNAVGMRRLAEIVSANKKKRAEIEADADVSVRQTHLDGMKRRLDIEQQQQQAQIAQALAVEKMKAGSTAETEAARQISQRATEQARIQRELEVRMAEIERDRELREREVHALLAAETTKLESQIALAKKRAAEMAAQAETELARRKVIAAQEAVQAEKEKLAAEREKETALIRTRQEAQTSEERAKSEVKTLLERVQAEAKASDLRAAAKRAELKAEADGRAAIIGAENAISDQVLRMKIDMHKIDKLPELAERMMKPVEKIDSIRINQIQGMGVSANGHGGGSPIGNATDAVLNLAFQLPAMQKLGQSLGLNLDLGDLENGESKPRGKKAE